MCDPLTIAGIALTAGSTVANSIASNKAAKARDQALAAERIRQQGYDQEAAALNTQSQDRYQDFEGQQEAKSGELGDYFKEQQIEANNAPVAGEFVPASTSSVVNQEETKQRGKARDFSNAQGEALGNLRSFGDLLGGISRMQARDASQIGTIGGFKRGSASVNPLELDAASHAGDGAKLFGDILGLGGSVSLGAGLSGPKAAADPWAGMRQVGGKVPKTFSLSSLYGG